MQGSLISYVKIGISGIHKKHMAKVYRFDKFRFMDPFQKEITYFLSVAETLNISKAAELLGIQQSGLSRAIHRLEEEVGQKLFVRKNNGLSLSDHGQQFFQAIKDTKLKWEDNFNSLLQSSENPAGLLKLGLHSSFGQNFLPKIVSQLTDQFPQLEMEIQPLPSFQVARKVLDGELDFGLVASPLKQAEIVMKVVSEDYLATFQSIHGEPPEFLLFNPETQMANSVIRKFSSLRKITIKDYELIAKTALSSRKHLALLPHSVAKNYPGLQQVGGKYGKAQISLICHKDKIKSKAYRRLYDQILKSFDR